MSEDSVTATFVDAGDPAVSSTDTDCTDQGDVIVVAARKPSQSSKVGIRLMREHSTGAVYVAKISDTSLFIGTALAVGMPILSVNRSPTSGKSIKDLSFIFAMAEDVVELEVNRSQAHRITSTNISRNGIPITRPAAPVMRFRGNRYESETGQQHPHILPQ